jgi:glyoxylase I family protein
MPIRYTHTNLIAHDWEKLAAFYVRALGCEPLEPKRDLQGPWLERASGVANAHLVGRHLRLPGHGPSGPTLEIFQYTEVLPQTAPAANRAGLAHLAFAVDDVAAALAVVVREGGSALGEVVSTEVAGAGRLTFTYAKDPEGNLIELQAWG